MGRYVVDHCDVLIALWDGMPSSGQGGTAEIVSYAKEQCRPVVIFSTETGDVAVEVPPRSRLTLDSLQPAS